jgi:nucleoid-associated protein YgaU
VSPASRRRGAADRAAGAAAFVGLLAVLVAVPFGLTWAVGWPLPYGVPSPDAVLTALRYGQIAPSTLVRALAAALWLIWAATVLSLGIEIVAVARGTVARAVPGLGAFQHAAGRMVATVMLVASVATRAGADTPPLPSTTSAPVSAVRAPAMVTAPGPPDAPPAEADREGAPAPPSWTVRRRDSLWTIAEHTLGDGRRWREIAALNVGRRQPDGRQLGPDSTLIRPGWSLKLPTDATVDGPPERVTVSHGDDLWSIAEQHLGDGARWPEIHARNRGRPQPDGRRLRDPDELRPGWTLHLPTRGDGGAGRTRARDVPARATDQQPHPSQDATRGAGAPRRRNGADASGAGRGRTGSGSPVGDRPPQVDGTEPSRAPTIDDGPVGRPTARSPVVEPQRPGAADDPPRRAAPVPARPVTPRTLPPPGHDARPTSTQRPVASHGQAGPVDAGEAAAIVGGTVLAAMLIGVVHTRRRHWLRRRRHGERPAAVDPEAAELERWLRSMADQDLRNRIDRTLRVMSDHFGTHGVTPAVRAVEIGEQVTLHLADGDCPPPPAVTIGEDRRRWTLAPELEVAAPSDAARRFVPALVSCGRLPSGALLHLNPFAVAGIGVVGTPDVVADIMTSWVTELASEGAERGVGIVVVGRHHPLVEHLPRVIIVADPARAVDRLGRTSVDQPRRTVVLCNADAVDGAAVTDLLAAAERPDVGVVVFGEATPATTLEVAGGRVRVRPGNLWLDAPSWLTPDDWDRFGDLLRRTGPRQVPVGDVSPLLAAVTVDAAPDEDGPAGHIVGVLGPLSADDRPPQLDDDAAQLLTYLAVHRTGADPATLSRIVWPRRDVDDSRLDAALEAVDRAFEATVVVRTDDGRIELVDDVACDLGRFRRIVHGLDHLPPSEQARRLYTALHLVRGEPFADGAAWAHADGTALETTTFVVDLAHRLAMHALTIGDAARARWAVDRGLLAAPSSELLFRDRMRVADARGDAAALDAAMHVAQRRAEADGGWVSAETEECYRTLTGRDAPPGEDRDAS